MSKVQKHTAYKVKRVVIEDPTLFEQILNIESVGWIIYLLGLAMIPASYFFNTIVTEYYWSKTLWAVALMPTSLILAVWSASRRGKLIWRDSYIALPFLIFFIVCVLSMGWAANVWKSLERGLQISGGFFAFWAGMHYVNSRKRIMQLLYLSVLVAFGITLYGLMQYTEIFYLPKDQYNNPDPSTTIGLTNFVVEYLDVLMALIPVMVIIEKRWSLKILLVLQGAVIYYYFLIGDNRGGYLAVIAEIGVMGVIGSWIVARKSELVGINRKTYFSVLAAVAVAIAVGLAVTPVGAKVVDRLSSITDFKKDASIRFRIETWKQCINNVIPDNVFMGVGLANIEVEFPRYYTDFLEGMTLRHNTRVVRAHNDFIQVMVDLGLLGLIPFLWFLAAIWWTGVDLYRTLHKRDNFLLYMGLAAGITGFLVNAMFAFPFQVPSSSMNFFMVVILLDRFRSIIRNENNLPLRDREIPLNGNLAMVPAAIMGVTFMGQIYGLNYSYHALVAEVRNKEARVFKRFDRWNETLGLMNEAVRHNRNMEGYWYDRAVAYMHFKRYEDALSDLQVTAVLVPNYGMGRKQIGVLAAQLGKTELAIEEFKAALSIFKSQREELMQLMADTAIRQGKASLYLPIAEEAFAAGVTDSKYYIMYANALAADLQYGNAVSAYEVAAKQLGDIPQAILPNYATALMYSGRAAEAEEAFSRAVRAQPGNAHSWYNYAKLQAATGRMAEARESLYKSVTLDPRFRQRVLQDEDLKKYPELVQSVH